MKKFIKTIILSIIFLSAQQAFAGDILFQKVLPNTNDIKEGDEILLDFNLEGQGEVYNAVEGSVSVGKNFEIESVVTGNSIISIWLKNPASFENPPAQSGNTVNFSGIIPAGYNRETGNIFSLILRAKTNGFAEVQLSNTNIFKNDGRGTSVSIREKSLNFDIKPAGKDYQPYKISVKDTNPPEDFKVELTKDKNLFDGKYTLIFSTRDLGSGIKSYDVLEGRKVFKQVVSPYVLENQHLNGKIKVVAYDFEDNTREVQIVPPGKVCVGVQCFGFGEIVIFVAVISTFVILWRKFKK